MPTFFGKTAKFIKSCRFVLNISSQPQSKHEPIILLSFCFQLHGLVSFEEEKTREVLKKHLNGPASAFTEVKDSYSESPEEIIQGLKTLSTKEFNQKFEEIMVSFFIMVYDAFIC